MVHKYLKTLKGLYRAFKRVLRGVMESGYYLSDNEVKALREDFKAAMSEARKYIQEQHCDCVFSKEEIEILFDLTKQIIPKRSDKGE